MARAQGNALNTGDLAASGLRPQRAAQGESRGRAGAARSRMGPWAMKAL